jgi:hypothetical protein
MYHRIIVGRRVVQTYECEVEADSYEDAELLAKEHAEMADSAEWNNTDCEDAWIEDSESRPDWGKWIVELYAEGNDQPSDCLPDFYRTEDSAKAAAYRELARVAAIPPTKRDRIIDWAVRFTLRDSSKED